MKNKKHNCYTCRFRGEVTGSAHSCCSVLKNIYGLIDGESAGFVYAIRCKTPHEIIMHPVGVANGWAAWPIKFDPIWVEECGYYEEQNPEE